VSTGAPKGTIRLSILDRLIDHEPEKSEEVPLDDNQKLRIIQHAVRRDLENLLNTRYRIVAWPPELTELDDSLINYGIPDFTAAGLNAALESEVLIKAIRNAISLFEPRLTDVRIERTQDDFVDRTFRFRIEALLLIEEKKHRVQFDSSMESTTGQIAVK
jgi:type VI secretion system protein ImpF